MKQSDEELLGVIRARSTLTTQAEVVFLLAHDLGHRAMRITETVERLIKTTKRALGEKRSPESIMSAAGEARNACMDLEKQVGMIRGARFAPDDIPVTFQPAD